MREARQSDARRTAGDRPAQAEQWIERSRAMLDCIVAGIAQIDEDTRVPRTDKKSAGSVDLF
jgi:hypothetical protein